MPRRISGEVQDDVARRYQAGESPDRIADSHGLGRTTVFRLLGRAGVASRVRDPGKNGVADRVVALYRAGKTYEEIGREVGRGCATVWRIVNAGGGVNRNTAPTPGEEAEFARLYATGLGVKEVAVATGRADRTVHKSLRRAGRTRRPNDDKRVHFFNERFFAAIDNERAAYWLGFLGADGNVSKTGQIQLHLKSDDRGHLEKFAADIGFAGEIPEYTTKGVVCGRAVTPTRMAKVYLQSKAMAADLAAAGLTPRKSLTYAPWEGPPDLMPHYWRGLLDGDGSWCIDRRGRGWFGLTGTRAAVGGFCGFVTATTGYVPRPYPRGNVWQVKVANHRVAQQMARAMFAAATVWLDRKKAAADAILATPWVDRRKAPGRNGTAPAGAGAVGVSR